MLGMATGSGPVGASLLILYLNWNIYCIHPGIRVLERIEGEIFGWMVEKETTPVGRSPKDCRVRVDSRAAIFLGYL